MADWAKRDHSKGDIDRAGALLVPWWSGPDPTKTVTIEIGKAFQVVQNWRTCHAMPLLTFRVGLDKRAKRVQPDALVAQRLKRFSSVMNKLVREPAMKLSQMQDLGGCRAIVADVNNVIRLFDMYRGASTDLFEAEGELKCYDYIHEPKDDGYRGVHVVGRYRARFEHNEPWNGQRIEIQLRTHLQHAFATAVETVTTFTRHRLKFGSGPDEWRRFFSLAGSAFAIREGTAPVPGTPDSRLELVRELKDLTKSLKVRQRLAGWARALRQLPRQNVRGQKYKWLLLVLNVTANTIRVVGYTDSKEANRALADIEKREGKDNIDAVLVWIRSAAELKAAYPNYYADTGGFIAALNEALRA